MARVSRKTAIMQADMEKAVYVPERVYQTCEPFPQKQTRKSYQKQNES